MPLDLPWHALSPAGFQAAGDEGGEGARSQLTRDPPTPGSELGTGWNPREDHDGLGIWRAIVRL